MKKHTKKIFPPSIFYALALAAIFIWLIIPEPKIITMSFNLIGLILIILGVILNIWTDTYFKKFHTTVKPDKAPSTLITYGPFKISRDPMYLGMVLVLFGEAILLGLIYIFIIPISFIILVELFFIPMEEKTISLCFPKKFRNYKKNVRRWI